MFCVFCFSLLIFLSPPLRSLSPPLSPIIEQSPSDETFSDKENPTQKRGPAQHGTIMGEALSLGPHSGLANSCTTVVHPPPVALSFRDNTLGQSTRSPPRAPGTTTTTTTTTTAAWSIFTSQVQPATPALTPPPPQEPEAPGEETRSQSPATAAIGSGAYPRQEPAFDVPMSPECGLKADWLVLSSPEAITEPDLDTFISPPRTPGVALARRGNRDVSMTPDAPTGLFTGACTSPAAMAASEAEDEPMSPDRGAYGGGGNDDVPMSPAAPGGTLVSDPWDAELITELLSRLNPPLGSHPHCISWQCNVPNFTPRTTITMGEEGQGAHVGHTGLLSVGRGRWDC